MTVSTFGRGGVFSCQCCERRTRETTQGDDTRWCGECFDLLGMQNTLWDDGYEANKDWLPKARDTLLAKIKKLGGNVEAVKKFIPDLFAEGIV